MRSFLWLLGSGLSFWTLRAKGLVSAYLLQFSLIHRKPNHRRVDRDVLALQVLVAFAGLVIVDGLVSFSELEVCHVPDAHDPVQHAAF